MSKPDESPATWRLFPTERLLAQIGEQGVIRLTGRECQLVALLAEHAGGAVSRDLISETLLGREWLPGDRAIDVLVRRVRSKLETAGGPQLLQTERLVGYSASGIRVEP